MVSGVGYRPLVTGVMKVGGKTEEFTKRSPALRRLGAASASARWSQPEIRIRSLGLRYNAPRLATSWREAGAGWETLGEPLRPPPIPRSRLRRVRPGPGHLLRPSMWSLDPRPIPPPECAPQN